MRVFVYEYVSAGGLGEQAPSSLRAEGWAMLSAVLADFSRVPGIQLDTILGDDTKARCVSPLVRVHAPCHSEESVLRQLAAMPDYVLLIAPEFADILGKRCRWVEEAGGRLLGPSSAAVRQTSDKRTLADYWSERGVPTPPVLTRPRFPAVWKPRYGAGSQATFLVRDAEQLASCAARARTEGWEGEAILQPFVSGLAASVALLLGSRQQFVLPAAAQELSADGRFHYQGGRLPLAPDLAERAGALALRAVQGLAGLRGYIGVDLVLGAADDGSQDWVIEINPRLTTSYVGLRMLARTNLAQAMLDVVRGEEVHELQWQAGAVRFRADGILIT